MKNIENLFSANIGEYDHANKWASLMLILPHYYHHELDRLYYGRIEIYLGSRKYGEIKNIIS